ncbi:MAG: 3-hydroxybutyrate dehydrogenase [Pyrinomonadaceae bacterium]
MQRADLKDKVAVITGAASGIGLATARALAASGAKTCLVDIDDALLEKRAGEIRTAGNEAFAVRADLANESDIESLKQSVTEKYGTADILINNAGLQVVSPIDEFPVEKWDQLINVMLRGAFLCTRKFLPGMADKGWGRIVNIASIHSIVASPYKSAYISAKHGLIGLTKTAALEAAEKGVTVNAVSPAYVRTPLVEKQITSQAEMHSIPEEQVIKDIMLKPMPQKELIEPDEVSSTVLFLCSPAARHINGHNLVMDGGWTIT